MVAQSCASKWTDESEFQLMWWRSTTGVPACKSPSRVRYQAGTSDGGQWSTACPEAVRFTVRFVQDAGGGCGDWEVRSIVETTAIETAGARAAPPTNDRWKGSVNHRRDVLFLLTCRRADLHQPLLSDRRVLVECTASESNWIRHHCDHE